MFCQNCGYLNSNDKLYCQRCGSPLDNQSHVSNPQNKKNTSNTTNILIICITVLIIVLAVAGTLILLSSNNDNAVNNTPITTQDTAKSSYLPDDNYNADDSSSTGTSLEILSGSFYTGSSLSDKTHCKVFVGTEHSGEKVKISVLYRRDSSDLNQGKIVPVTVDNSGYVSVASADSFKYYPDWAFITLYDNNGEVQDTREVYMSAIGGTQNF